MKTSAKPLDKSPERSYNEKNVNLALLLAQQAIASERGGKFESALKKYEDVVKIFGNEVPLAPPERKSVLQLYVSLHTIDMVASHVHRARGDPQVARQVSTYRITT